MDLEFERLGSANFLAKRRFRWPYEVGLLTHYPDHDVSRLIVQTGTGNVIAGDHLSQRFTVGPGARVQVVGQGAVTVNRRLDGQNATEQLKLSVAANARLEFIQEPRLILPYAEFKQSSVVDLDGTGQMVYVDAMVRHPDDGPSSFWSDFVLLCEGEPVAVERMRYHDHGIRRVRANAFIVAAGIDVRESDWTSWLVEHASRESYGAVSPLPSFTGSVIKVVSSDGRLLREAVRGALSVLGVRVGGSFAWQGRAGHDLMGLETDRGLQPQVGPSPSGMP